MATSSSLATAAVVLVFCSAVSAEPQWNASLAALADDNDSHSIDADAGFAPVEWVQFGIGAGSTRSPSTDGEIHGKSLRGSVDLRSGKAGLRTYYRRWNSPRFDTDTVGARASFGADAFTFSVAGEKRGFDVAYMSGGSNPQQSNEHFAGTGWGGGLKYSKSGWTGYTDAMFYHYGSLSRYVQTYTPSVVPAPAPATPSSPLPSLRDTVAALPIQSGALNPILPGAPQSVLAVAPVLTTSVVTVGEGALDRIFTAGIERAFTKISVRLEWTGAKDAILSSKINSYRAGIGYVLSQHVNIDASAGVTDSYAGSAKFAGVSLGFSF